MCAPNWLTSSLLQRMEPSKFGRAMKKLELTTVTLVKVKSQCRLCRRLTLGYRENMKIETHCKMPAYD